MLFQIDLFISKDFNFTSFMAFQNIFQIDQTTLYLAQLKGHHKIVELLSLAKQN